MTQDNNTNNQEPDFNELFSNLQNKLGGLMDKFGVDQSMLDNFLGGLTSQNMSQNNEPTPQDEKKTSEIATLTKLAANGDAQSQFLLGKHFFIGDGVEEDNDIASDYFEQAAEQGLAQAQVYLGRCYFSGFGVEKNIKEAVNWYTKAAEQGDSEAQAKLADCLYEVTEISDYDKAFYWYSKSSEQGDVNGTSGLARCYYEGNGTEQNYEKAFQLFTTAAEAGNEKAQRYLADCYGNGFGTERDSEKAAYWLDTADETSANDPEKKLENHKLQLQNEDEIEEAEEEVQDNGNPLGGLFDMIGNLLGGGADGGKNFLIDAIKIAAERGETDAQLQLGDIYYNGGEPRLGITVEKDLNTALYWYNKASENGNPEAASRLENFKNN